MSLNRIPKEIFLEISKKSGANGWNSLMRTNKKRYKLLKTPNYQAIKSKLLQNYNTELKKLRSKIKKETSQNLRNHLIYLHKLKLKLRNSSNTDPNTLRNHNNLIQAFAVGNIAIVDNYNPVNANLMKNEYNQLNSHENKTAFQIEWVGSVIDKVKLLIEYLDISYSNNLNLQTSSHLQHIKFDKQYNDIIKHKKYLEQIFGTPFFNNHISAIRNKAIKVIRGQIRMLRQLPSRNKSIYKQLNKHIATMKRHQNNRELDKLYSELTSRKKHTPKRIRSRSPYRTKRTRL